jgi:hypothetical protein
LSRHRHFPVTTPFERDDHDQHPVFYPGPDLIGCCPTRRPSIGDANGASVIADADIKGGMMSPIGSIAHDRQPNTPRIDTYRLLAAPENKDLTENFQHGRTTPFREDNVLSHLSSTTAALHDRTSNLHRSQDHDLDRHRASLGHTAPPREGTTQHTNGSPHADPHHDRRSQYAGHRDR